MQTGEIPTPTERLFRESELRESELRYRRLFEAAQDGILILDAASGRIEDVNPFLSNLLGFSHEEMVGKTIGELSPFKNIESNKVMLERLQTHGVVYYEQLLLETSTGRKIAVELDSHVYQAGDRTVIQCNIRDITTRKHAEAHLRDLTQSLDERGVENRGLEGRLIEAQKMEVIGQLAGGVAHDFNNILAVIIGYGDLIASELSADSPLLKYVAEIRIASDRAAGLTRQLLIFSRKHKVIPVVLDLNAVMNDLDKMLRRLVHENISMTFVHGPDLGHVKADAGYVGQVLMNLVVNARDAMIAGGALTIATQNVTNAGPPAPTIPGAPPGEYVMLSVEDTGTGMTDEVQAHLFEPFFTTKAAGHGTGLGLATCLTIVQQSGGYIHMTSTLGTGSTFRIYLPRVEQPLSTAARAAEPGPIPRGTETLLVVEDEPSVRHLACGVLNAQGYEVLSASNGQDALHVAQNHHGAPIRLVVTDVVMPLMGGKVMVEWLKIKNPALKVLFTSGYPDDTIAPSAVLDRGVEFLAKPYTPSSLTRRVREMLDQKPEPSTPATS
jgi:PAS domain S-box-containing protein